MDNEKTLLVISVIAVVISMVGAGITYVNINEFQRGWLTGLATDTATLNLSVESQMAINFTVDNINWGSGTHTVRSSSATLDTSLSDASNVTNGNWTGNTRGLVLENVGNKKTESDGCYEYTESS